MLFCKWGETIDVQWNMSNQRFVSKYSIWDFDRVHGLCGVSIKLWENGVSVNHKEKRTSMAISIFGIVVSSAVSSDKKKLIWKGTWRLFTDEQKNLSEIVWLFENWIKAVHVLCTPKKLKKTKDTVNPSEISWYKFLPGTFC